MTTPNGLTRRYPSLSAHERYRLSVMARARGDEAEFERLGAWGWGEVDRWSASATATLVLAVMLLQERCRIERAKGMQEGCDILLRLTAAALDGAWDAGYRVGSGRDYRGPEFDPDGEAAKALGILDEGLAEPIQRIAARLSGILAGMDDWARSIGLDGDTLGACFLPGGWAPLLPDGVELPEADAEYRAETLTNLTEWWRKAVRDAG